jgi:hypothetical protein
LIVFSIFVLVVCAFLVGPLPFKLQESLLVVVPRDLTRRFRSGR